MAKPEILDIDTARKQIEADSRTDSFLPTVRCYTSRDDVLRLTELAERAGAQRDQGDEWAMIEGLAWIEVAHADEGRSSKKALAAFEAMRDPTLDSLRWRAHASAIGALVGNAKHAWEQAAELYREVLAKAPDDPSASLMFAESTRRHVKHSFLDSPQWAKVAVPALEEALSVLATPTLLGNPLGDRERGLILALLGRHSDSLEPLRVADAALASIEDVTDAWSEARTALVVALAAAGRVDEAIALVHAASVDRSALRYELALALTKSEQRQAIQRLYAGETDVSEHESRLVEAAAQRS